VIDLMEALRRSVAEVQGTKRPKAAPPDKTGRSGSRKKAAAKR
jgi:non-homologous end joining protein Ku